MPVNSRMTNQELRNLLTAMDCSTVPQEKDSPFKMLEKSQKKAADIQAGKVSFPKLNIKRHPFPLWRNRQSTDGRNPMLFINVVAMGSLALWGPGTGNRRNKQETTFIHEEQRGPKSFGVFLYAATDVASKRRFPLRCAATRGAQAFDNSTPCLKAVAKHGWGGSRPRILSGSLGPLVGVSKDLFDTRRRVARPTVTWTISLFVSSTTSWDVQVPLSEAEPLPLAADMPDTSVRRSSWMPLTSGQRLTDSLSPFLKVEWRVGAASPVLVGSRGVACPIV
jgi:hypothetical protein